MIEVHIVTRRATKIVVLVCAIISVLASYVLATPLPKPQATTPAAPQKVTVLTYNIQQLGYPNWLANHFEKQRLALIPDTILALSNRPDVLVLQEVFTEHSFKFLVNTLSEIYPHHTQVAGEDCKDGRWTSVSGNCAASFIKGNSGVLILSRWPIRQQHAYVFHAVRVSKSFDFLARKGVVYAKIQVEHGNFNDRLEPLTLHVFGTHLQASTEEHDIRLLQLDEMRRFIDGFKISAQQPVILAGDFNISSTYQSRFNDLLAHSLAKVTLVQGGIGSMSDSTNGYRRLLAGADSEINADTTLDYVLYRTDHLQPVNNPALQVIDFKSKTPWLGTRLFKTDVELTDLSDHYPAIIEFEF